MPELRKDPVSGRWVIISVERGKRPTDFVPLPHKRKTSGFCPFCPGNEHTTPNEILVFHDNKNDPTSKWTLRVVPNKFPALQIHGELSKTSEGIFDRMTGIGAHEIIIETPDHSLSLATMPQKSVEDVLQAYFLRMMDLKKDSRFKYVLIFKNEGDIAGAPLEHSHSQIIALPIVPKTIMDEEESARRYFDDKGCCLFCDIMSQELHAIKRVIYENHSYIAIAPFAPRAPFETWILPKQHVSSFISPQTQIGDLAEILQRILKQIDRVLGIPPYNFILHTSPLSHEQNQFYHWHIEIVPKLAKIAGFEWGSGFYINPTPPEEAVRYMKEVAFS